MAPMVGSSCLPQDGMTEGLLYVGCSECALYLKLKVNRIPTTTPDTCRLAVNMLCKVKL